MLVMLEREYCRMDALTVGGNGRGPSRWVVRWRPASTARLRLFCLPHAGGSSFAYRQWAGRLAPEIEVISIRLPGRDTRHGESGPRRIQDLAAALTRDIAPLLSPPYGWFGHSMGALAAFEACRAARSLGLPASARLLVSGHAAPHIPLRHRPLHDAPEPELVAQEQAVRRTACSGLIPSAICP